MPRKSYKTKSSRRSNVESLPKTLYCDKCKVELKPTLIIFRDGIFKVDDVVIEVDVWICPKCFTLYCFKTEWKYDYEEGSYIVKTLNRSICGKVHIDPTFCIGSLD